MGIMTTISVIRHHHRHNIHHYHWLWSSGQVGTVSHPKVQTLSNRTPDAQPAIAMEGGAADRNHSGRHITGNHRAQGGGGIPWGGGGKGGLAALHHIGSGVWHSQPPPPPMVWSGTGWGGGGGWRVRRGVGAVGAAAGETARCHRQGQHSTQALRKP